MINISKYKLKMQRATPQQLAGLSRRQERGDPPLGEDRPPSSEGRRRRTAQHVEETDDEANEDSTLI
jgi:hypothetical protein